MNEFIKTMTQFKTILFLSAALLTSCGQTTTTIFRNTALDGLNIREYDNEIKQVYVYPTKVVWKTGNVSNVESLLDGYQGQLSTKVSNCCVLDSKGDSKPAIVFDYGKELNGGVLIAASIRSEKGPIRIRVRLGESVSEVMGETTNPKATTDSDATATNDHAMRDFEIELPWLGEIRIGDSGFRFVRIDLLDKDVLLPLSAVQVIFKYRDIPYLGSFKSNDQRLNQIWATGAYTVHLNMQDYIWDGVKRDRLVWVGDLHPELTTINHVFGSHRLLNKTLDYARDNTPLPGWMNGMCSYSLWWLISQHDLHLYQGDKQYLDQQKEYTVALLDQVLKCVVDGNENLDSGIRFLDWPTSRNSEIIHSGLQGLTIMALKSGEQLSEWMDIDTMASKCKQAYTEMLTKIPIHYNNKQAASLMSISGLVNAKEISEQVLEAGGAVGLSTFYGYYIIEAMASAGRYSEAMKIISDYWGAMLDLGATTFWEDLDYPQALKSARIDQLVPNGAYDIHGQGGDFCYTGHRHSLCHGWASGPTAWLSKYVLGIIPVKPGCTEVKIEPNLGDLQWVKGTFPTPQGIIYVEHVKTDDGRIESIIKLPNGVKQVN